MKLDAEKKSKKQGTTNKEIKRKTIGRKQKASSQKQEENQKTNPMKKFYKQIQNSFKNHPLFTFKNLFIECPAYITNLLLKNPHSTLLDSRHWWDNYPEVDSVKYDKTLQYIPKYE